MKKIAIYIPNYNGGAFLKTVKIPNTCECVVIDNCSTDNSKEVCGIRGFTYIGLEKGISRVENWMRCIRHFEKSKYDWMKWLFVGDELAESAGEIMQKAVEKYPEAAAIVFDYEIVNGKKKVPITWKKILSEKYIDSKEALKTFVTKGYFGTPICTMLSKHIEFTSMVETDYIWAADIFLFYQLIRSNKIAYEHKSIGSFIVSKRNIYSRNRKDYFATIEVLDTMNQIKKYYENTYCEKLDCTKRYNSLMRICLENHSTSFIELLHLQKSVFRSIGKTCKIFFRKED